jgi:hypothetical protein
MMTREAKTIWARRRRRLIAYGQWQPTQQIDPAPARAHINKLRRFGLSVRTIALLAGEQAGALSQIIYPNHRDYLTWITAARAERILAVSFNLDSIPSGRNVDAAGTRRRIEALMRVGWSQGHIGRALGVSRQRVFTYRSSVHVESDTARAVRDLFEQWWDKPGPEIRAINKAIREGFPPPLAWDDIDDPDAEPNVGTETLRPGGGRPVAELIEDIEWLLEHDPLMTASDLDARLGYNSKSAIQHALEPDRGNRPDLLERLARNASVAA